jgi:class 3 adenylate cyclase/predicted ATPase/flagellin-specific chaperone FliS
LDSSDNEVPFMTTSGATQKLYEYLTPHMREHLEHEGDLPVADRKSLAAHLHQLLNAYVAYIPGRLVQHQLEEPEPGRVQGAFWNGSLLFADLSGFTSLSAELSVLGKQGAEEVSGVVNQLFNALVDEVLTHHGTLLKFGGDALTAFFDAETLGDAHAHAATLAALAMQQRMEAFSALKTRKGTFCLKLRVGVHSGQVFAAEVGDTSHIELVVTGAEVNRVATAQEIAAPGEVVISDYTAALLEGAVLAPREAGFQLISALPSLEIPTETTNSLRFAEGDGLDTLILLARQVAALRPYLMRGLPGRFLDATIFEVGEFRPVSVVFVNFHDFSAMLERLSDNALCAAQILNAYYRRAQRVVHRYEGIVNKVDMYTHGDKLMVLFGAPITHEDDPQRAVRCALEFREIITEANQEIASILAEHERQDMLMDEEHAHHMHLQQRIGINTGTVFAGRVGGARRYEYTVMGSAVNLSARLMSATEDETILLSPETSMFVERQIALAKQPPLKLKGLPEPVEPFRALHALDVERSPVNAASFGISRAPLIGRERLLIQLKQEAVTALRGSGRVVALVGDAGIGKSRLVEELMQSLVMATFVETGLAVPDFQIYTNDCQSYEQSMPYAALRKPLRNLLRFGQNGYPQQQTSSSEHLFTSIETTVQQLAPDMVRFTPLLSDALGVVLPQSPLTESLEAEQRHDRLQELLVALLKGFAAQEPLLLSLEDIQWADASSLELLGRLSQEVERTPLLILLNYRPDPPIDEPWRKLAATTRVALHELPLEESEKLLAGMLGGPPPPEILPLLERTQGNPFFIEELVRAFITSEVLARTEAGTWHLTRPLDQVTIPTSIEGLIYARLDRLHEKLYELVQVASVIGRRFSRTILEQVYSTPDLIDEGLQSLIDGEMIAPDLQDTVQDTTYIFRHALLRDVAYEGILYSRRRNLHRRVAYSLENVTSGGYREDFLTLLAQHYLLAEEWMFTFYYHRAAGIYAQQRYANREALALYATCLDVAPHLEQEPWCAAEDQVNSSLFALFCPVFPIQTQIAEMRERSGYLHALLGEGEQAETSYLTALKQVTDLQENQKQWKLSDAHRAELKTQLSNTVIRLHRHMATLKEQHGSYETAFEWLEHGMSKATSEAWNELARCYLLGARIYYYQAEFDRSMEWARMASTIAERLGNNVDQAHALLRMGILWCEQGDLAQAIPVQEKACALFEEENILTGLHYALNDLGLTHDRIGRWDEAVQYYQRSLEISESIGDVYAMARASNNLALVRLAQGELQRASDLYEYSCEQFRRAGSEQGVALTTLNRGEVLLLQGEPEQALLLLNESVAILERINARIDLPEALRLSAEAMLQMNRFDEATSYATRAAEIASELGMSLDECIIWRTLGQIALHKGDFTSAIEHFEQSRAGLELQGERYELGKVLFCQARLTYMQGDTAQADQLLQQAKDIFVELDAQRDLEQLEAFAQERESVATLQR